MSLGGRRPPSPPDADLIRTLAALLTETGLTEIEYASGDFRIRIARNPAPIAPVSPSPASPVIALAVAEERTPAANGIEHPGTVKAPLVGIAYLAPQPGTPPFVREGDIVAEGQTLLIIEAMKVMNQIQAPHAGRVARILIADADAVEYGAPLMLIE